VSDHRFLVQRNIATFGAVGEFPGTFGRFRGDSIIQRLRGKNGGSRLNLAQNGEADIGQRLLTNLEL
jgi:hypothetical protein